MSILSRLAADRRLQFILVNVGTNLLMLGRSYAALRLLDDQMLGLVTLFQTVMLFIGMLQFGILQGGFRLQCDRDAGENALINTAVFSFIGALGLGLTALSLVSMPFLPETIPPVVLLAAVVAGVATLARSWVNNQHVAAADLDGLNRLTLATSVASLLPLIALPWAPLTAVLVSMLLQPLLFVWFGLSRRRDYRPDRFHIDPALFRRMLGIGFALFMSGMLVQLNMLAERSFVTAIFGIGGLGRLFLAYIFITLFQLVPTSLDSIFLPGVVSSFRAGDAKGIARQMWAFLAIAFLYCAVTALAVAFLADPVVALLLPNRTGDMAYVRAMLPGLLAITLAAPFGLVFHVLIRFRAYYLAYGAGTVVTIAVLAWWSVVARPGDLAAVMHLRSIAWILTAALLVAGYKAVASRDQIFRLVRLFHRGN